MCTFSCVMVSFFQRISNTLYLPLTAILYVWLICCLPSIPRYAGYEWWCLLGSLALKVYVMSLLRGNTYFFFSLISDRFCIVYFFYFLFFPDYLSPYWLMWSLMTLTDSLCVYLSLKFLIILVGILTIIDCCFTILKCVEINVWDLNLYKMYICKGILIQILSSIHDFQKWNSNGM